MFVAFLMGIAIAFMYPQQCYRIFIDKTIIVKDK